MNYKLDEASRQRRARWRATMKERIASYEAMLPELPADERERKRDEIRQLKKRIKEG